ncbi:hypothetical protein LMG28688_02784 [Paraburkholderia caffeinitolerans]|uniref:Uncharacterized protein n=1 Tax=Paraburkholderia caffeinitolerans TaxID=1723730 RepID=A0A6J5FX84_9BURK|nr:MULTISPECIES: hypothetical protein [Paraburkholderia]CAB3788914.1 hypothetical protein LMG28688_02784 [Paraburkholderia caffeinitolerans]
MTLPPLLHHLLFGSRRARHMRVITLERACAARAYAPLPVLLPCPAHTTFPSR